MSHNVTLNNVKIMDEEALAQAIRELAEESGVDMTLEENSTFRAYGGTNTKADLVLKIPSCQYDVGFNRDADGALIPVVEDMASDVRNVIGVSNGAVTVGDSPTNISQYGPQSIVGRLHQRVNVIVAENEAARAGKSYERSYDVSSGLISLRVSNY